MADKIAFYRVSHLYERSLMLISGNDLMYSLEPV